jgi:hypothetical protein
MRINSVGKALLAIFAIAAVPRISVQDASNPAQTSNQTALNAAAGAADSLKLAAFFGDLANQERALADSYRQLAKAYNERNRPAGLDPETERELKSQFKRLAESERRASKWARTLAAYHIQVAEAVSGTPAPASAPAPRKLHSATFASFGR